MKSSSSFAGSSMCSRSVYTCVCEIWCVCVFLRVCVCHGWICIRQPQQRRNALITQSQQQSDPNTLRTHPPYRPHLIHSLQPTTPPTMTWPKPMQHVHESKDTKYMKYANFSTHPSLPILPSNVPMVWDFHGSVCCSTLQCVAVCCSVLQCVAVCCSVLQCVTACCGVLQCVAVHGTSFSKWSEIWTALFYQTVTIVSLFFSV